MHLFALFYFLGALLPIPSNSPLSHDSAAVSPSLIEMHSRPMDLKASFNRVLKAPLVRGREEPSSAGWGSTKALARTISSLQPTFVSGVLQISSPGALRSYPVEAFQWIRNEVLAANPHCKFDVELTVSTYLTGAELVAELQEITSKVSPDAVLMVVPKNNEVIAPSAVAKGIEFAHLHHQVVGYEGPLSMIPDGVDFLVMSVEGTELHREEIAALRAKHHLPLLMKAPALFEEQEAPHGLNPPASLSGTGKQALLLTHLAEEQNAFGYHLMYPITFPTFHGENAFDKASDHSLLVTMRALMAKYN